MARAPGRRQLPWTSSAEPCAPLEIAFGVPCPLRVLYTTFCFPRYFTILVLGR